MPAGTASHHQMVDTLQKHSRLVMNNLICLFLGFIDADEQFLSMYHFPCVCFLGFPGSVGCTEVCGKRWQLVAGNPGVIRLALRYKGLAKLSFSVTSWLEMWQSSGLWSVFTSSAFGLDRRL